MRASLQKLTHRIGQDGLKNLTRSFPPRRNHLNPSSSDLAIGGGRFQQRRLQQIPRRCLSTGRVDAEPEDFSDARDVATISESSLQSLTACPGCGALAQTVEPGEAGYYSLQRRAVDLYLKQQNSGLKTDESVVSSALESAGPELVKSLGLGTSATATQTSNSSEPPLCNRCHQLIHHRVGNPIHHPSIESLADTIAESPYKYNHIYHVVDAADFPMSLVKDINILLSTSGLRSKNRRAQQTKFKQGKVTDLSFIVTRSDLLVPKKEQVDGLMPYLVEVLRASLGAAAKDVRLGNVKCVSARRGWWTKELKADVWKRGGAGWMVGKVNVGKSNLFEVIFPKGKAEDINFDNVRRDARRQTPNIEDLRSTQMHSMRDDENSLLPPARAETPYPLMPTVSSLPGTTASPIRIPFGNGKGELIDLPGLARSELEQYIEPEHRDNLVMKARAVPEQYVIKPGQSLLLGDLVRITPKGEDNLVILAYPFTPLKPHLTSTEKAITMQSESTGSGSISSITTEKAKQSIASAGIFDLQWDVTRQRAGPLTTSAAAGLKPKDLPFKVLSIDILIESVGWIELVAQVRKGRIMDRGRTEEPEDVHLPQVEVFTPAGKFIGSRQPMNAWLLGGHAKHSSKEKGRPRKSMASVRRSRSPAEKSLGVV
jgi:hypothetical protein